jgi:hypothetical protein
MSETAFWDQLAGSGSANIITIVAVGLFIGLRKLCNRNTKCKSHLHCCCLDVDVRDRTLRMQPGAADEEGPASV